MFDLVDEKFSEVLDIHFTFTGIHHSHSTVKLHIPVCHGFLHRLHYIRKLPHAGRLDQNTLRRISIQNFL